MSLDFSGRDRRALPRWCVVIRSILTAKVEDKVEIGETRECYIRRGYSDHPHIYGHEHTQKAVVVFFENTAPLGTVVYSFELSGSEEVSSLPRPLRTVRAPCNAHGPAHPYLIHGLRCRSQGQFTCSTSARFRVGYGFPVPFGGWPWLLGASYSHGGVSPSLRFGY